MRRLCAISGCTKPPLGRGLCRTHYYRAKQGGYLDRFPTITVDYVHPTNSLSMPDMPETCAPIVPNPAHYRPWRCARDELAVARDGCLPTWSSWLPMHATMTALEERDAARDARDAARYDLEMVDGRLVVRMWEQVAA